MNEQRPNPSTRPEPIPESEQNTPVHGDKLEDAVVRIARGTKPARDPKDLRGDEVME